MDNWARGLQFIFGLKLPDNELFREREKNQIIQIISEEAIVALYGVYGISNK